MALRVLLSVLAHGAPHNRTLPHPLRRNVCDGIDAKPILYHEYHEDDGPAENHLNPDGSCSGWSNWAESQCVTFCQIRTNFEWAQESPFPNSECHWPVACTISEGDSTSWNWGISITPKIKYGLKLGISGGYGETYATSTGHSWSFTPEGGECGYFTFVPVRKSTCGTLSEAWEQYVNHQWSCIFVTNTGNYCADQVWYANGVPDETVLFVRTDCLTREPLGPEFQDPVYSKPGVPLDRGHLATLQQSWVKDTCSTNVIDETADSQKVSFTVKGKGFADEQLGTDGVNLNTNITGCGTLDDWKFEWTPDNGTYHWAATGTVLGIAVKPCIGKAVLAVGGSTADACTDDGQIRQLTR